MASNDIKDSDGEIILSLAYSATKENINLQLKRLLENDLQKEATTLTLKDINTTNEFEKKLESIIEKIEKATKIDISNFQLSDDVSDKIELKLNKFEIADEGKRNLQNTLNTIKDLHIKINNFVLSDKAKRDLQSQIEQLTKTRVVNPYKKNNLISSDATDINDTEGLYKTAKQISLGNTKLSETTKLLNDIRQAYSDLGNVSIKRSYLEADDFGVDELKEVEVEISNINNGLIKTQTLLGVIDRINGKTSFTPTTYSYQSVEPLFKPSEVQKNIDNQTYDSQYKNAINNLNKFNLNLKETDYIVDELTKSYDDLINMNIDDDDLILHAYNFQNTLKETLNIIKQYKTEYATIKQTDGLSKSIQNYNIDYQNNELNQMVLHLRNANITLDEYQSMVKRFNQIKLDDKRELNTTRVETLKNQVEAFKLSSSSAERFAKDLDDITEKLKNVKNNSELNKIAEEFKVIESKAKIASKAMDITNAFGISGNGGKYNEYKTQIEKITSEINKYAVNFKLSKTVTDDLTNAYQKLAKARGDNAKIKAEQEFNNALDLAKLKLEKVKEETAKLSDVDNLRTNISNYLETTNTTNRNALDELLNNKLNKTNSLGGQNKITLEALQQAKEIFNNVQIADKKFVDSTSLETLRSQMYTWLNSTKYAEEYREAIDRLSNELNGIDSVGFKNIKEQFQQMKSQIKELGSYVSSDDINSLKNKLDIFEFNDANAERFTSQIDNIRKIINSVEVDNVSLSVAEFKKLENEINKIQQEANTLSKTNISPNDLENLSNQITTFSQKTQHLDDTFEDANGTTKTFREELERLLNDLTNVDLTKGGFNQIKKDFDTLKTAEKQLESLAKKSDIDLLQSKITKLKNTFNFSKDTIESLNVLEKKLSNLKVGTATKSDFEKLNTEFKLLKANAEATISPLDRFKQKLIQYGQMYLSFYSVVNGIKQMIAEVKELDDDLLELSKVSNMTAKDLKNFTSEAFAMGDEVGRKGTDVINAVTEFKRAGYTLKESSDMAQSALIMTNVAEGIESTSDASGTLISVLKGFNMDASETLNIVDKINEVSNKAPINFDNIADGLERTSATLHENGNSIDESIGLITAGYAQLRDIPKVTSGIITISARLRGVDDETGETIDGLKAKMQDSFSKIGVNIEDANGELRSLYDIARDYAKVYDTLTSKQKQYYGELASGKRQVTVWNAIISNFKDAESAVQASLNSSGSAMLENEKYMDSLSGKYEMLQSSVQGFANSLINSKAYGDTISLITDLVKGLTSLFNVLNKINVLAPVLISTVGAIASNKFNLNFLDFSGDKLQAGRGLTKLIETFKSLKSFKSPITEKEVDLIHKYFMYKDNGALEKANKLFNDNSEALSENAKNIMQNCNNMADANVRLAGTTSKLSGAFKGLMASFAQFAIMFIATELINGAIKFFDKLIVTTKEYEENLRNLKQSFEDNKTQIESNYESAKDLVDKYQELSKGVGANNVNNYLSDEEYKEYLSTVNNLVEIYPELLSHYDAEGNAVLKNIDLYKELIRLKEEDIKNNYNKYLFDDDGDVNKEPVKKTKKYSKELNVKRYEFSHKSKEEIQNQIDELSKDYNDEELYEKIQQELGMPSLNVDYFLDSNGQIVDQAFNELQTKIKNEESELRAKLNESLSAVKNQAIAVLMNNQDYNNLSDAQKQFAMNFVNGIDEKIANGFTGVYDGKNSIDNYISNLMSSLNKLQFGSDQTLEFLANVDDIKINLSPEELKDRVNIKLQELSNQTGIPVQDIKVMYNLEWVEENSEAVSNFRKNLTSRLENELKDNVDYKGYGSTIVEVNKFIKENKIYTQEQVDEFVELYNKTNSVTEAMKLYAKQLAYTNNVESFKDLGTNLDTLKNNLTDITEVIDNNFQTLDVVKLMDSNASFDWEKAGVINFNTGEITSDVNVLRSAFSQLQTELINHVKETYPQYANAIDSVANECVYVSKSVDDYMDSLTELNDLYYKVQKGTELNKAEVEDLTTKYPALKDAVIETANGFSFEENALVDVYNTQVETSRAGIASQINLTQKTIEQVQARIKAYLAEQNALANLMKNASNITTTVENGVVRYYDQLSKKWVDKSAVQKYNDYTMDTITLELAQDELNKLKSSLSTIQRSSKNLNTSYKNNKPANTSSGSSGSGSSRGSSGNSDSSQERQPTLFDWIERKVKKLSDTLELAKKKISDFFDYTNKNIQTNKAISLIEQQISNYTATINAYNKELSNIGLSADLRDKIENGAYTVDYIKDEELKAKVNSYKEMYDKITEARKSIESLRDEEQELYKQRLDNIKTYYDYLNNRETTRQKGYNLTSSDSRIDINSQQRLDALWLEKQSIDKQSQQTLELKNNYERELNSLYSSGKINFNAYYEGLTYVEELNNQLKELSANSHNIQKQMNEMELNIFQKIENSFQNQADYWANKIELKQASGETVTKDDYYNEIHQYSWRVLYLQQQISALEKLKASANYRSEEWFEYSNQLDSVNNELLSTQKTIYDLRSEMFNNTLFKQMDDVIEKLDKLKSNLSEISDIINDDMIFDENGIVTDLGITKLAVMTQMYDEAKEKVNAYIKDIELLENTYRKDRYNPMSDEDYETKLKDLQDGLLSSVKDVQSIRDSFISLYEQQNQAELDSLKELIQLRVEALNAKKSYYDYDKNIKSKTKDIKSLEAQILALEGVEDQATKTRKAQLEAQLQTSKEDLNDTIVEHRISLITDGLDDFVNDLETDYSKQVDLLKANLTAQAEVIEEITSEYGKFGTDTIKSINDMFSTIAGTTVDVSGLVNGVKIDTSNNTGTYTTTSTATNTTSNSNTQTIKQTDVTSNGLVSGISKDLITSATATKDEVIRIQRALNSLGITDTNGRRLSENGIWDSKVTQAIQKFQESSNWGGAITANGKIDSATKAKFKRAGYYKGGIVKSFLPVDDELTSLIKDNKDSGLITAKVGEAIIPSKYVPDFVDKIESFINMPNIGDIFDGKINKSNNGIIIEQKYDNLLNVNGDVDKEVFPGIKSMLEQSYKYNSQKLVNELKKYGYK